MTRETVRTLKRAVRAGLSANASDSDRVMSRDGALALLSRSIAWGHGKLAVIRLAVAVDAGARIQHEHWVYCARMAQSSGDARLQEIYRSAAIKAYAGDRREATF